MAKPLCEMLLPVRPVTRTKKLDVLMRNACLVQQAVQCAIAIDEAVINSTIKPQWRQTLSL